MDKDYLHKLYAKWKRRRSHKLRGKRAQRDLGSKGRDYAWRSSKANPMTRNHQKKNWLPTILWGIGFIAVGFLGWFLLFHPKFLLSNIEVTGAQRIDVAELKEVVTQTFPKRRLLVLPGRHIAFVRPQVVHDVLNERYALESLAVEKEYPNTLRIALAEKISTIIYDDGSMYRYIGPDGLNIEALRRVEESEWFEEVEISTTTLADGTIREERTILNRWHTPAVTTLQESYGAYPVLYDEQFHEDRGEETQFATSEDVRAVLDWYNTLTHHSDIDVHYITLHENGVNASIHTVEGWSILVDLRDLVDDVFDTLMYALTDEVDRASLSYIDLRYSGRVYWQ